MGKICAWSGRRPAAGAGDLSARLSPDAGNWRAILFPRGEGSIRLLADANAQIANQYSYNSFGQRLTAVESVPQPYGWKGRDFIPGPNIYYNRARFYDPVLAGC